MQWSISIQLMWQDLPFPERARAAARASFDLVDLWDWRTSDIDGVAAACEETGIGINGFFGTRDTQLCDPAARADVLDELQRNAEVAQRVGARQLHVFSNAISNGIVQATPDLPREALLEHCAATLREAADRLEGSGITLVLEHLNTVFLPGYLWADVQTSVDVARRVDKPDTVGAVFDTFHQQLVSGRLTESMTDALPWLRRIDLAGVPGRHEPGAGEIDLGYLLRTARGLGWDGTVTFECEPSDGNPTTALASISNLMAAAD